MDSIQIIRVADGGAISAGSAYRLFRFYRQRTEEKLDFEEWKVPRETWRHGASCTPPQQNPALTKSAEAHASRR